MDVGAIHVAERGSVVGTGVGGEGQRVAVAVKVAFESIVCCAHHAGNADVVGQLEIRIGVVFTQIHVADQAVPVFYGGNQVGRRGAVTRTRKQVERHDGHHLVIFDLPSLA